METPGTIPAEEENDQEVDPNPEPEEEPSDPHRGPLDDPDDSRFLDKEDARRKAVDQQRENGEEQGAS